MLTLYQFPISHYCEKIRWALDYKGLEYELVNLLPGEHIRVVKKLTGKTSVPVLDHDGTIIQNSSDIISYLDDAFPQNLLTPADATLKQSAIEWEAYADSNIGPHIRLYSYHYLLDYPAIVYPFLTQGQPWHKKVLFRMYFGKVRQGMRKFMKIEDRTATIALKKLQRAIDKIDNELDGKAFLVGDQFTRADLAAASLLAPFCRPPAYGLDWPDRYPEGLEQTVVKFRNKLSWVNNLYATYRS